MPLVCSARRVYGKIYNYFWEEIVLRTYLVTGGAGFIGSNYIHYMFRKYDGAIRIINVDCLTYAGNLENATVRQ